LPSAPFDCRCDLAAWKRKAGRKRHDLKRRRVTETNGTQRV